MVLDFAKEAMEEGRDILREKMAELLKSFLDEGILGKSSIVNIDGQEYYVTFNFRKIIKACKECGREL